MVFNPPAPPYVGPPAHTSVGKNDPITRIVLHGTVSPCVAGGARTTAAYFRNPASDGSAHYITDPAEAVQCTWDSVIAWHAPPNPNSLGIEMCDPVGDSKGRPLPLSRWDDHDHQAMMQITAKLVAELCLAYDVPVRMVGPRQLRKGMGGICEHSDVSKAFGQSSHWDLGLFPRRRFLRMVQHEVAQLTTDSTVKPSRVDLARDLLRAAVGRTSSAVRKRRIQSCITQLPPH